MYKLYHSQALLGILIDLSFYFILFFVDSPVSMWIALLTNALDML